LKTIRKGSKGGKNSLEGRRPGRRDRHGSERGVASKKEALTVGKAFKKRTSPGKER